MVCAEYCEQNVDLAPVFYGYIATNSLAISRWTNGMLVFEYDPMAPICAVTCQKSGMPRFCLILFTAVATLASTPVISATSAPDLSRVVTPGEIHPGSRS